MEMWFEKIFVIYILVFLFLLLGIFFVLFILKVRKNNNIWLNQQIEEFILSKDALMDEALFSKVIKNEQTFSSFLNVLKRYSIEVQKKKIVSLKPFFLDSFSKIRNRSIIYQVFFLRFLSQYPNLLEGKNNPLLTYVAECCISDSFYLVDQAFLTINCFGNSELVRKTLLLMNQHNINYHSKLITNSLLTFHGNDTVFCDNIAKDIKKYNANYQVALIDFLGIKKLDLSELILSLLVDQKEDKEVRLACIRYFSIVRYKYVRPVLYDFLKDDVNSWEYAAIAAKALINYPGKETTNHLLEALGSYSWYVRNNAAKSIIDMNDSDIVRQMLRQISDKYAHEALVYQKSLKERKK